MVLSFNELIKPFQDSSPTHLISAIKDSKFKYFVNCIDSMYLVPLKYYEDKKYGPRAKVDFDVTPKKINEDLRDIDPQVKQKLYFHNFKVSKQWKKACCPKNDLCVDFEVLYLGPGNNHFINSIITKIESRFESNIEKPLMINKLLNKSFAEIYGSIKVKSFPIKKNQLKINNMLFFMKNPPGGTWNRKLKTILESSTPPNLEKLYASAQLDPEFNPEF